MRPATTPGEPSRALPDSISLPRVTKPRPVDIDGLTEPDRSSATSETFADCGVPSERSRWGKIALMRLVDPLVWFTSEMRRERLEARDRQAKRRAKALDHRLRSVALAAVIWGGLMWVAVVRTADVVALIALAVTSIGYGFAVIGLAARMQRRVARKEALSDHSSAP